MLTQLEERLAWFVAVLLLGALLVIGLEHKGAQKCLQADKLLDQKAEVHNATVEATSTEIIRQEANAYADALARPVLRPIHVSVCNWPATSRPMRESEAAAASTHADTGLREPDHSATVQRDLGPELQTVGKDADAQIRGLQDYIRRVCPAR